MENAARYGWGSAFPLFRDTPKREIREKLQELVHDASPEQIRAWDESIPKLQREITEVLARNLNASQYATILEYELPMEARRPDVVFLVRGGVVVAELKGKRRPSQADIDQAAAYARDLRCYHRDCADRRVEAAVVPTLATGYQGQQGDIHVLGPDALDEFIERVGQTSDQEPPIPERFLSAGAYRPLPTLVKAARELFERGDLRPIHRARAATDPAVGEISTIIHEAARTKSRRLILLTGVPGAGKTLVGLRVVHAHFLDDLSVERVDGKPTTPAVFLSGNAPLVEVLQYQLREAGGAGKAFVRGVKDYVTRYSRNRAPVPPEHVLVFDEAQRAFDAEQVRATHKGRSDFTEGKSEPEYFIEFAERVPEWCVVVGLIGGGQEIHIGEEAGLVQWRVAIERSSRSSDWRVHAPPNATACFSGSSIAIHESSALDLTQEIRFHAASELHRFVSLLLEGVEPLELAKIGESLEKDGYHLRVTRDFELAKTYLRERYADDEQARFGLIASSRDKALEHFGIENGYNATKQVRHGPWYSDSEDAPEGRSCRQLTACVTEFGAQGLELDAVLLAWGTDLQWIGDRWSTSNARRYKDAARVKNPHQLRVNAYRVLLTRGRDGTIVFVPPLDEMDATYERLRASGFQPLRTD
jgi:hypothetical protein